MKAVLQRVSRAKVTVDDKITGEIGPGLLVLFGVEKTDSPDQLDYFVKKLLNLRIFADEAGKMNRSVKDINGGILVVSQFTLAGDCRKGNRPGFDNAMPPTAARHLYQSLVERLQSSSGLKIQTGEFGAMMQVDLVNDGPVTFLLEN
ncbi:MAG: D-tyrosyl-tRNA(Tyr) deacylase [Vampirovibrio sp.]|nr:D-tyrosyl-tRNA(Tyr) deacylase [Vampirovibrio sp.]